MVHYFTHSHPVDYVKRSSSGCKGQQTGSWTARFTDHPSGATYSVLYYDDRYRVIQRKGKNEQNGIQSVYTAYNFEGSPTKEKHVHSIPGEASITEIHTYTYDLANRLLKTVYQLDDDSPITLVDNMYDEIGRLLVDKRNSIPMLRTNYTYNLRSWIKGINSPLFGQTLCYQEAVKGATPYYNGNISRMLWRTAQNNSGSNTLVTSPEKGYSFTYDGLSRMKDAIYGEGTNAYHNPDRFNEQITSYDKMGNILGLLRYGQTGQESYGLIDNLNLTYGGNQLLSVSDNATNSVYGNGMEFKDGSDLAVEYEYDKNGNLTKDLNKKITEIEYNLLNLPSHIIFADGNRIEYEYAADGRKARTTHIIGNDTTSTVYCGNAIYENGTLKMLLNEAGYYSFQDSKFHFYLKDHQGNIRVVADEAGVVDEVNDYYPFGGLMSGACNNTQPYKYNGKELDRKNGLDWYDYGARYYDAALGRWHVVDTSSEKYYGWSSYSYCINNFINCIDPKGEDVYILVYSNADERFEAAAQTRKREILNSERYNSEKDNIYMLSIGDLGTLGVRVGEIVKDANAMGYGKTVETAFYTHGGTDGPVGDVVTSGNFNLSNETGHSIDRQQMNVAGWSLINWNFDSKNSIAAFYGCHTAGFAERFLNFSDVAYTAGQGGSSGPSYSTQEFDSVGAVFRNLSKNIYYGSRDGNEFIGVFGQSRTGERGTFYVQGNAKVRNGKIINASR